MDAEPLSLSRLRADLPNFTFNDYLRHMPGAEAASLPGSPLRVAIVRSYTAEPVEPMLKLRFIAEGFRPTFWIGGYNQYVQEIVNPASGLHAFRPDLILLLIRLEELLPDFVNEFGARPTSEWKEHITAKVQELGALFDRLEDTLAAQVIVQNATLRTSYFGVFDSQTNDGQSALVQQFNRELAAELASRRSVFVWDFERFAQAYGYERLHDPKMWYVSRNPYKQAAYPAIGEDLARCALSVLGRVKKCIVVDLDNTLWGGVAGEDGIDGVALGRSYPGNCFRDFQSALLKLYHRGILLAINSKNNEQDALHIIDNHPDMVLRREHFAAMRINWQDKATNLREIARELNIGIDSCIFLDDNAVECDLVRRECPECEVVHLPDKPYLLPDLVARLPGIENVRLTTEDRRKGEMYRERAARQRQAGAYTNIDEFLRSLDIEVEVQPAASFSIPRIAQLTQKTNQLNVTTRRYTEAQIQTFADDPAFAVYSVAAKDRFGSEGIIGVFILHFRDASCRIDTLLLSCRVIGRGIEQYMVATILDLCRDRGVETLVGEFLPTPKNQPAADLYSRLGFVKTSETLYMLDVATAPVTYPQHIRAGAKQPVAAR